MIKECKHCQKDFENKRTDAIYCTDKCRIYSFRKQKAIQQKIEYNILLVEWAKENKKSIKI